MFDVPTTLEAFHDLIARYASGGKDVSVIIERIHKANSVRLDRRNTEKMQNFYDVLLRRFMAVGDAIFESGGGGDELGRYGQLDSLTKILYAMAQDSPSSAGAVWSRRLGILHNAHAKRLRDAELVRIEGEEGDGMDTAWPSWGTFLLLRALGHIFPVTDQRHHVVSPAVLLLGQVVSQTPVCSSYDLAMGVMFSGLLLEYTKEAKRFVPEAFGFLAGAIRIFSKSPGDFASPSLAAAYNMPEIQRLRNNKSIVGDGGECIALRFEKEFITDHHSGVSAAVLHAALALIENYAALVGGSFSLNSERELMYEVSDSVLTLQTKDFPKEVQVKIAAVISLIMTISSTKRHPLRRREDTSGGKMPIKSLAPRLEDPTRYSMSKDKGKKATQAAIDRTRREYKREHKAISRELRLDSAFIENERRAEKERRDSKARDKRQKNFAWLEGEQASMNEQVRLGGGLLKGGGMGAARLKAATGKLGIKRGGKF